MQELTDTPSGTHMAAGLVQTCYARVYAQAEGRYGVAGPLGGHWVQVAASCLLQPDVGDRVLVSLAGTEGYILAVLAQADPDQSSLRLSGNARIYADRGTLTLGAREGMAVMAGPALSIQARDARLTANTLGLQARTMRMTGDTCHSVWREHHDVAKLHRNVSLRSEQQAHDRVTRVSGHDELSAGSQRILIQKDWRVRARNTDIRARERASVDAGQIHLG